MNDTVGTVHATSPDPPVRERRVATLAVQVRRREQVAGWSTLVLGLAISGFLFWRNQQYMAFEEYYLLNTALLLWPPLVLILLLLRRNLRSWGMVPGDVQGGLRIALLGWVLFLPVLLIVSRQADFQRYYLTVQLGQSHAVTGVSWLPNGYGVLKPVGGNLDIARLLYYELIFGFYMLAWEWFFRGFLLFGLRRVMPVAVAALIQAALFCLLHWGKPWTEVASSFPGGLLLAWVAIRYRSFLPCFVLHYLISVSFDGAVLFYHFHR